MGSVGFWGTLTPTALQLLLQAGAGGQAVVLHVRCEQILLQDGCQCLLLLPWGNRSMHLEDKGSTRHRSVQAVVDQYVSHCGDRWVRLEAQGMGLWESWESPYLACRPAGCAISGGERRGGCGWL